MNCKLLRKFKVASLAGLLLVGAYPTLLVHAEEASVSSQEILQTVEEDQTVTNTEFNAMTEEMDAAQAWLTLSDNYMEIEYLTATVIPAGTPLHNYSSIITDYVEGGEFTAVYPEDVIMISTEMTANGGYVYSSNGDGTINVYDTPSHWHEQMTTEESLEYTQSMVDNTILVELSGAIEDIEALASITTIEDYSVEEEPEVGLTEYTEEEVEIARAWLTLSEGNAAVESLNVTEIPAGTPINRYYSSVTDYVEGTDFTDYTAVYPEDVKMISSHVIAYGVFTYSSNGDGTINVYDTPANWQNRMTTEELLEYTQSIVDNTRLIKLDEGNGVDLAYLLGILKVSDYAPSEFIEPDNSSESSESNASTESIETTDLEEESTEVYSDSSETEDENESSQSVSVEQSSSTEESVLPNTGENSTLVWVIGGIAVLAIGLLLLLSGRRSKNK